MLKDPQDTFLDVPEPSSFGMVEMRSYRRGTYCNGCGSIPHIGIVVLGSYGFLHMKVTKTATIWMNWGIPFYSDHHWERLLRVVSVKMGL